MKKQIQLLEHNLGVQVLLESMLYSYICDNYENMRQANPVLANLVRNDIHALHRNHEVFISKFRPILNEYLLEDYDSLRKIIEEFLNEQTKIAV